MNEYVHKKILAVVTPFNPNYIFSLNANLKAGQKNNNNSAKLQKWTIPFILTCNASSCGLGYILGQRNNKGGNKVTKYSGRALYNAKLHVQKQN